MKKQLLSFILISLTSSCLAAKELPLNLIQLPPGFSITKYADVPDAREMALGDNGIVYVGNRDKDKVYAVIPDANGTKAKEVKTIASDLKMPNGVAYKDGNLYVVTNTQILRFDQITQHLDNPKYTIIYDQLPNKSWHGWRYAGFGPDQLLYIAIGAPCNSCVSTDPIFATISRFNLATNHLDIYAKGIRNSVGFAWSPLDKNLWFTDNGQDFLGDNLPPDKLNHAPQSNMHFGFPYVYGQNIPDPKFGNDPTKPQHMTPPTVELGPHVASLGMKFYTGKQFPEHFHNQIFIAEHGSWARSHKIGYRITWIDLHTQKPTYKIFASGWLQNEKAWGRPVDLLIMADGSMLVSDDHAGVIYRITYNKQIATQ